MLRNPTIKDIGKVIRDTIFIRKTDKHYMNKYKGFGLSQSIIDEALDKNLRFVIFDYKGKIYETTVGAFNISDKIYNNKGDIQKFISLTDMEEIK